MNDVIQFLPRNQNIWGAGKILIISRNQNILNSKYVDSRNVIQVPTLNLDERKNLFQKIYSTAQNENLLRFLEEIPPYPLDVSAAAYFLKNTRMGYEAYLEHIEHYESAFRKLDSDILKNTDNHFKTRYTIVSSTIQKIIDENDDFKNKLLEISLLAPGSVPVELLDDEQHKALSLILELSRYSLVNNENIALDNSISLHRSIHTIIYLHLMDYLKSDSGSAHLKYFSKKIASQLSVVLDKEDINKIKSIGFQSGIFMKNVSHSVNDGMDDLKYQIGRSHRYLGRFKEAILILESTKSFDQNIPVLLELGTSYTKIGKYHKAVLLIEKALKLSTQQYGPDSIQSARVEIRLDTPYRKLKKYDEERQVLEHSLRIHLNDSEADQADIAWIYTKLGHLQVKQGDLKEGLELFNKSLKIQMELYGQNNIRTAWTYVRMANAYKESYQPKIAQELFTNSLKVYREHYGKNHPKTAWVLYSLGEVEGLLGHFKLAEKYMDEGLSIQKQYYGDNSIRLSWGLKKLAELYKRKNLLVKAGYYFDWIQKIQQETKQENLEES